MWRPVLLVVVLALASCGAREDWGDGGAEADSDARYLCRGMLGLRCPVGQVCVDIADGCRPELGGMDCIGECIEIGE